MALVTTLHDPEARLLPTLHRVAPRLALYDGVYVCATDATASHLLAALDERGAGVIRQPAGRIGDGRRAALGAAFNAGHSAFLYCDLDRWLYWAERFPDELEAVPTRLAARRPSIWYACMGRTARAFASHPLAQRATEGATNRAASLAFGRRIDVTAGCCWLSREGAAIVLRASIEATNATDAEWPALIHRADPRRLGAVAVDGLAFETASFFAEEVAAAGGEAAWIAARYDRPEVWLARLRLATDSVAALRRVLG